MGKQSTLGKFWELPKGTAAPAKQQADLRKMWAPKTEKKEVSQTEPGTRADTEDSGEMS